MKYIGLAFAIGSLFVFVRLYIGSLKRQRLCYAEISRLLSYIDEHLRTERAPLSELCRSFRCGELAECGFFELAFDEGKADEGAERLLMDSGDKERLKEFLFSFGSGYLDTEIKRTSLIAEHFRKRNEEEAKESNDKIRVALLLFCSFALALALLCV